MQGYYNDLWKYQAKIWFWISGSDLAGDKGNYGTLGIPSALNVPSARHSAASWIDSYDHLWLFGGATGISLTNFYSLNDLWKFDGNWTWVSGSNQSQPSIYESNNIGSRYGAAATKISRTTFALFGGAGVGGSYADLWILEFPELTTTSIATNVPNTIVNRSSSINVGAISGIVVGSFALLVLLVSLVLKRILGKQRHTDTSSSTHEIEGKRAALLQDIEIKQKLGGGSFGEGTQCS